MGERQAPSQAPSAVQTLSGEAHAASLQDALQDALAATLSPSSPRIYNERLILSLLRRHGPLSKIEVARHTGLSAQTAAALMNRLSADGLIGRLDPLRGRVGQPAVPFALAPEGAFSAGLKIGRRSCDLVLVDFTGTLRWRAHKTFSWPMPATLLAFVAEALPRAIASLSPRQRLRMTGLGIATPFELWNWGDEIGAPKGAMDVWRDFDILSEVSALCACPVTLCNDATAACAGEMFFGQGWRHRDIAYFFVGSFIGGGIALNGALYSGHTGNAGALGSMPVCGVQGNRADTQQLIRRASIYLLEHRLIAAGIDPSSIWRTPDVWDDFGPHLDAWLEEAGNALALASLAAISVIDFDAIVVDGAVPPAVRSALVAQVTLALSRLDRQGLSPVRVLEGTIGSDARAIGGAALPLLASFGHDREALLRTGAASLNTLDA